MIKTQQHLRNPLEVGPQLDLQDILAASDAYKQFEAKLKELKNGDVGWHMWPEYTTKMGTTAGPCIPLSYVQKASALAPQGR